MSQPWTPKTAVDEWVEEVGEHGAANQGGEKVEEYVTALFELLYGTE